MTMPTGLQCNVNGLVVAGTTYYGYVDLEAIFHARGTVAPATSVSLTGAGRNLSDWFYPRSAGGTTLEVDTGFNHNGTDIRQLYAKRGTVGSGGGGGGGCLPFETPVMLWDNGTKAIGELRPGDTVIGIYVDGMLDASTAGWEQWTAPTGTLTDAVLIPVDVVTVMLSSYTSYYLINGTMRATFEHPFLVDRAGTMRWVTAADLQVGDGLITDTLETASVESVRLINQPMRVANINVEQVDNYLAQLLPGCSVLTHNNDQQKN
ncbi:Hint domain-containing protein [Lysobacter sp. CA199]|uniref:Hint domain-containing protein n=1 Tax=Lysobacter sp. CA199 TaxID=3455608 RepID=UPI003F8D5C95